MGLKSGSHVCTEPALWRTEGVAMQPANTFMNAWGHGRDIEFHGTSVVNQVYAPPALGKKTAEEVLALSTQKAGKIIG